MTPVVAELRKSFWAGLRPDERLTPDTWADKWRILSSAETADPGLWSTDRTPYLREPMQRLALHDPTPRVVMLFAAQMGKTEVGNNLLGYIIDHAPCPVMVLRPTIDDCEGFSKQRLAHILECPRLAGRVAEQRSRTSSNTLTLKVFQGGIIILAGANAPSRLASWPARVLFADEVDRYPPSAGTEGDPLSLARKRLSGFGDRAKELITSTPTVANESRIEDEYKASTRAVWEMPCPSCGAFRALTWTDDTGRYLLQWEGDPSSESGFRVWYTCPTCGHGIEEAAKGPMLAAGRWRHEDPGRLIRGYKINALAAPIGRVTWRTLVAEWMAATTRTKAGDTTLLRTFVNTRLAEAWEDKGEGADALTLENRVEEWGAAVPTGARVLTAGVDVQDTRLEIEVVAWGLGLESWSVAYHVIPTDPLDVSTWRALDAILTREFPTDVPGATMRITAACVDSGFRTQAVYDYVRNRARWRVYATKGRAGRIPIWDRRPRKGGKKKDRGVFYLVGVDTAKDSVASYLAIRAPGPGYCHFPASRLDDVPDYFRQLAAERRVKSRDRRGRESWTWKLIADGRRNEALDCRVYALAAVHSLTVGGLRLDAPAPVPTVAAAVPVMPSPATPSLAPTQDALRAPARKADHRPGRRPGSWITGSGRFRF